MIDRLNKLEKEEKILMQTNTVVHQPLVVDLIRGHV